jgi:hypothetical protein
MSDQSPWRRKRWGLLCCGKPAWAYLVELKMNGPLDRWTAGPLDRWTAGPLDRCLPAEGWDRWTERRSKAVYYEVDRSSYDECMARIAELVLHCRNIMQREHAVHNSGMEVIVTCS